MNPKPESFESVTAVTVVGPRATTREIVETDPDGCYVLTREAKQESVVAQKALNHE